MLERAPSSTWRRMDRAFVADLHFQEHGWLKDGLEREKACLNRSVWYPHQEWVRILQANPDVRPDGTPPGSSKTDHSERLGAAYPPISSYSNSGQDQSQGWSSASDSSRGGGGGRYQDRFVGRGRGRGRDGDRGRDRGASSRSRSRSPPRGGGHVHKARRTDNHAQGSMGAREQTRDFMNQQREGGIQGGAIGGGSATSATGADASGGQQGRNVQYNPAGTGWGVAPTQQAGAMAGLQGVPAWGPPQAHLPQAPGAPSGPDQGALLALWNSLTQAQREALEKPNPSRS